MSPSFVLTTETVPDPVPADAQQTFYWALNGASSFHSNVGPNLGMFGQVKDLNIDLVRIASGVVAADRSVSRSGRLAAWNERAIALQVPVSDPDRWATVTDRLQRLLGFLTGDSWTLSFVLGEPVEEQLSTGHPGASRVVLFSGGADSAIGAALSAAELQGKGQHILVSHFSSTRLAPLQRRLASTVESWYPGVMLDHIQIHHSRRRTAPNGVSYGLENSTRSRSLLFLAFGLAVASVEGVPLWVPENGYASVNPPLGTDRRGSLSTRTTHPAFLKELKSILELVGAHADLENPFASLTKGEMFTRLADAVGAEAASAYMSSTESCSHTGAKSYGLPAATQCGVCFGCVLRKSSFAASGLTDSTPYIDAGEDLRIQRWLDGKTVVPAMRDFLRQPLTDVDLATMRIPADIPLANVRLLCDRARAELGMLYL